MKTRPAACWRICRRRLGELVESRGEPLGGRRAGPARVLAAASFSDVGTLVERRDVLLVGRRLLRRVAA